MGSEVTGSEVTGVFQVTGVINQVSYLPGRLCECLSGWTGRRSLPAEGWMPPAELCCFLAAQTTITTTTTTITKSTNWKRFISEVDV